MIVAADGDLWFTNEKKNAIVRMAAPGVYAPYPLPTKSAFGNVSNPNGMTIGCDGTIWFAEPNVNQIGRVTKNGSIAEYHLSEGGDSDSGPGIAADRHNCASTRIIWFTQSKSLGEFRY